MKFDNILQKKKIVQRKSTLALVFGHHDDHSVAKNPEPKRLLSSWDELTIVNTIYNEGLNAEYIPSSGLLMKIKKEGDDDSVQSFEDTSMSSETSGAWDDIFVIPDSEGKINPLFIKKNHADASSDLDADDDDQSLSACSVETIQCHGPPTRALRSRQKIRFQSTKLVLLPDPKGRVGVNEKRYQVSEHTKVQESSTRPNFKRGGKVTLDEKMEIKTKELLRRNIDRKIRLLNNPALIR